MQSKPYTTRKGVQQFRPVITESEYAEASEDNQGFCLRCGEEAFGVEPDARRYVCKSCGAEKVYGLQELLLMGLLKFTE
jgi:hypothetical protein